MDRNDIVKSFLSRGYQLDMEALKHFEKEPGKVKTFLDNCGKLEDTFITKQTIESVLNSEETKTGVRILDSFERKPKETSMEDVVKELNERYEKTSEILSKKKDLSNLISVNRISQQTKQFSLIVSLKDVNPGDKSLLVEDPTGSITVYVSDHAVGDFQYLLEDEVVGLICDNQGTFENRVVKIIFPDIPLQTKPTTTDNEIFCMLLSEFDVKNSKAVEKLKSHLKNRKERTEVFISGYKDPEKIKEIFPDNFSLNFIESYPVLYDIEGVKILITDSGKTSKYFERFRTSPDNMMIQLLKKRNISPTIDFSSGINSENGFVESIPDIVLVLGYRKPGIINYKGVTSVSTGSMEENPIFWEINLKTRENIKIDLT